MKFSQAFTYVFTVICFYALLFISEIILLMPIIEGVEISYLIKIVISLVLLIIINPIITWLITERLPFKPKDLKASSDYKTDIKKRPKED